MRFGVISVLSLLAIIFLFSLAMAQKPELSVQTGHAGPVLCLAFSSDGRVLATGSVDSTIKLWDPLSGNQLRALKGHEGTVMSIAFSPDNRTIASGSADNTVRLWDVATGEEKQVLRGHSLHVSGVAFSPDGKLLASSSADQKVKLWDVATGSEIRNMLPNIDPSYSVGIRLAFSRDGKVLASAGEVMKLWDISSGKLLRMIKIDDAGSIPTFPIAMGPGGTVVTGGNSIRFWEMETGKTLRTIPYHAESIALSNDGKMMATSNLVEVKVWDVNSGRDIHTFEGPGQGVESVAFSPDGSSLVSGNSDNTIRFWNPITGEEGRTLRGYTDSVMAMAMSGDGKVLASGLMGTMIRKDTVRIWDPTTGQLLRPLIGQSWATYSLGMSADGNRVVSTAAGGGSIGMWNLSQPDQIKKFRGTSPNRFSSDEATLSPDGRFVAAGGRDGVVKMWDAQSGKEVFSVNGHKKGVRAISFNGRGDLLASAGSDKLVQLWSTTGQLLKTFAGHAADITALAFSPDGRKLASGSQDRTVIFWDIARGDADNIYVGNRGWVNAVVFSPDGRKLASGGEDGTILIWDIATKTQLLKLTGHHDSVNAVLFSSDSKLLISGSSDTSMKLWDVASGKELASLFSVGEQDWLVITPDGLFDGSPAAWNQILWRFSSKLFDVAPVELFFNEYYYPGLLADLYAGKRPMAPQSISQKDRRQPVLKLAVDEAQVTSAQVRSRNVGVKINISAAPAGAQDVRLFRNGALVKVWRGDVLKGQAHVVLETQIPIVAGPNRLTAYAFNHDNVKSSDATLTVTGSDALKQTGTLYIVAIAVNSYQNTQFDLRYAVADATDFATELQSQESILKTYGRTEIISLQDSKATKVNILGTLASLAARVKPEDAVVVYYAGHGTAQQNQFYLIPHDLGYSGARNKIDSPSLNTILTHSISDRELEKAFENIDAGQLLLIIDACNSGQALETEEKRRGPMNSKGLAQLAYEKGIYILTAAQSYQAALEPSDLKHGLLTYALVEEGLKQQAADVEPKDGTLLVREWFSYVMKRVPQMQEERMREAERGGRQLVYVDGDEATNASKRNVQRPRVFYRRELEERPFTVAKFAAAP